MKRFAAAATLLAAAASCSYYTYPVEVEHAQPSATGLDLGGRVMTVSFVHGSPSDSLCQSIMAEHFALGLEKQWCGGRQEVDLFAIRNSEGADYACRDTLVQLALSTDADVAFLFDEPQYDVSDGGDTTHVRLRLYAYDCLGAADSVWSFSGRHKYAEKVLMFSSCGRQLAGHFSKQWKKETYYVYFYEEPKWTSAALFAEDMKWEEAMKLWLEIVASTPNTVKRAVASYDIALSCYMLGNGELALAWLDKADSIADLGQSPSLRKRIMQGL